jgi:hypothetical protein
VLFGEDGSFLVAAGCRLWDTVWVCVWYATKEIDKGTKTVAN